MSFIRYNSITWGWQVATAAEALMENVRKLQRTFSFTSLHEAFMRESVKIPFYCHFDSLNPLLFPVCFIYLVYRNPSKESVACRQSSSRVELCRNLKKPFDVYLADLFSFAYEGSRVPPFSQTCFPENIGKKNMETRVGEACGREKNAVDICTIIVYTPQSFGASVNRRRIRRRQNNLAPQ